jgi:hypothetical protein
VGKKGTFAVGVHVTSTSVAAMWSPDSFVHCVKMLNLGAVPTVGTLKGPTVKVDPVPSGSGVPVQFAASIL